LPAILIEFRPVAAKNSKPLRICLWLFGVVFSLLPIGATYVNGLLDSKSLSWIELLSEGELFLIAGALAADAIFTALRGGAAHRIFRVVTGAWCLLVVVATSFYFGRIAYTQQDIRASLEAAVRKGDLGSALHFLDNPGLNRHVVAQHSLWCFALAVVAALCVIIVEED
jgi:hypothetical protein